MYHTRESVCSMKNPHDAAKIPCATAKTQCSQINKDYKRGKKENVGKQASDRRDSKCKGPETGTEGECA